MAMGFKSGGRTKGVLNKSTVLLQQQQEAASIRLAEVFGTEVFPGDSLEFMQTVYKDMAMPLPVRLDAAAKALPYERRKLPTEVEVNETSGPKIQIAHFTRLEPPVDTELLPAAKRDGDKIVTPLVVGTGEKGPEQD